MVPAEQIGKTRAVKGCASCEVSESCAGLQSRGHIEEFALVAEPFHARKEQRSRSEFFVRKLPILHPRSRRKVRALLRAELQQGGFGFAVHQGRK